MTKGMSFDELFPGKYIKAGEFKGKDVTLTVTAVEREMLSNGAGGEEGAAIVSFKETEKQFVMNKTNGVCFRAMFGDDTGAWLDHRITLHAVKDESGLSESGLCIRVAGSPEIDKPLKFRAHLGRKLVTQTLVPTKGKSKPQVEVESEPDPAEEAEEFAAFDAALTNGMNDGTPDRVAAEEELV
jgi:hypothetical protein